MIFVNRRRIIQNSGIVKDPTKYWYIEKYVYGKLKETVEVPLGTGTTFGSIDSGYSDDTFYGWSINSTSTTRKFTATTTYKNTTTAVKNNLDSENTLKIYAIYKYTETTWSVSNSEVFSCTPSDNAESEFVPKSYTISIEVAEDSTAKFGGFTFNIYGVGSSAPTATYSDLTYNNKSIYAKIDDDIYITGTVNTYNTNIKYIERDVTAGQIITLCGYVDGIQSSTIKGGKTAYCVSCTVPKKKEKTSTKYRVERYYVNIGGESITPIN